MRETDYKPLQVRSNVKDLIKEFCESKGISQSGLVAALIYTLDGRQNYGSMKMDWAAIQKEYPAPMNVTRDTWKKATNDLINKLDEYSEISILEVADEAQVDHRMVWTILCFLYDKGILVDDLKKKGGIWFGEDTWVLIGKEERALFDKAWTEFCERKQKRIERRKA